MTCDSCIIRQTPLVLVIIAGILLLVPAWESSYTYNEQGRIASGLISIQIGEFSAFHVNPPLGNLIGAIPSAIVGANCATRSDLGFSTFARDEYKAGEIFVKQNENHLQLIIAGRVCCAVLVFMGGWFSWKLGNELYGDRAGITAILLTLFSPYFLGFGCLICPDVPSAAFAVVSVYCFWQWLKKPTAGNAFIAGITLGLAELTKFTLLIFYPLFVLLWIIYQFPKQKERPTARRKQLVQLAILFAVSILVINMGYVFEGTGKMLGTYRFQTALFTGCDSYKNVPTGGANRFSDTILGYIPVPLPMNFIQGIDTQRLDFERGLPSYLRGEWSDHGSWHYYLYALLIKTPLGTIGLLLIAIYCTFFLRGYNASWRDEMVILLPGVTLLAFVSSQTGFSVHSRYVIPALPFFFVWMSKVGKAFELRHHKIAVLTCVLLSYSVVSSMSVYPHCISYFNELAAVVPTPHDKENRIPELPVDTTWQKLQNVVTAGPRNGPRHLLDSNIDWGQDLFFLEKWCQKHPEAEPFYAAIWGSYPIELTTIPTQGMPPTNAPQPGWHAISVNYLYDRDGEYRHFLNLEPIAIIGYTIYIYHIPKSGAEHD